MLVFYAYRTFLWDCHAGIPQVLLVQVGVVGDARMMLLKVQKGEGIMEGCHTLMRRRTKKGCTSAFTRLVSMYLPISTSSSTPNPSALS